MYQILPRAWGHRGNDSYTKLLLHCNGDDGSTSFRDDSRSDHTITANGDAQLDTAQKKFGKSSALFDGTGDYLSIPDSDGLNMGSGNFTIDFWVRFSSGSLSADQGFFNQYYNADNQAYCRYDAAVNIVNFQIIDSGTTIFYLNYGWGPFELTWYHIAIIRGWGGNANDWAITIDGSSIGTKAGSCSWPDFAGEFNIGRASTSYMNGWIDEFRVSKGIARWTANFTPPSAPYK